MNNATFVYGLILKKSKSGIRLSFLFFKARDDEFECTNVTSVWESGAMERCPEKDWTVSAVTGVYLLLSNLLLVNLVIAMFR